MIYTVKKIEEDLDFGCEERAEGSPVMAVVVLEDEKKKQFRIKQEDAGLYERDIQEGMMVYLDENNLLQKASTVEKQEANQDGTCILCPARPDRVECGK